MTSDTYSTKQLGSLNGDLALLRSTPRAFTESLCDTRCRHGRLPIDTRDKLSQLALYTRAQLFSTLWPLAHEVLSHDPHYWPPTAMAYDKHCCAISMDLRADGHLDFFFHDEVRTVLDYCLQFTLSVKYTGVVN